MGRGRAGQDQTSVETLLHEHTGKCGCGGAGDGGLACEELRPPSLFLSSSQGLIFVVDSNDRERIGEAKDELIRMVSMAAWLSAPPP